MNHYKKVMLLNPAIGSLNLGDFIISEAIHDFLEQELTQTFLIDVPTKMEITGSYLDRIKEASLKVVCGTNLLQGRMEREDRLWKLNEEVAACLNPLVLCGCGWRKYEEDIEEYSRNLWTGLLDRDCVHSVRDEYTAEKLISMGIRNVINTGCPTLWNLNQEFCRQIPVHKASGVITTLTYYKPDARKDKYMLECLVRNYEDVYLWIQGAEDYSYYCSLEFGGRIHIIGASLAEFDRQLDKEDVDYVGTRLHAGIRAMQHGKRSLIIGIDNRAVEMQRTNKINMLDRYEIETLEAAIRSEIITDIQINRKGIASFLAGLQNVLQR